MSQAFGSTFLSGSGGFKVVALCVGEWRAATSGGTLLTQVHFIDSFIPLIYPSLTP
jgi:hypothetical protein